MDRIHEHNGEVPKSSANENARRCFCGIFLLSFAVLSFP